MVPTITALTSGFRWLPADTATVAVMVALEVVDFDDVAGLVVDRVEELVTARNCVIGASVVNIVS